MQIILKISQGTRITHDFCKLGHELYHTMSNGMMDFKENYRATVVSVLNFLGKIFMVLHKDLV